MTDIQATLDERGSRYGDFTGHAEIAQDLQDAMRKNPRWGRLTAVQKQALTVIVDKIARIINGDPNYDDNWHDIQGYAKLAEDRLPKPKATEPTSAWIDWDPCTPTAHLGPRPVPNIVQVRLRDGAVCAYPGAGGPASWFWDTRGEDGADIVAYLVE